MDPTSHIRYSRRVITRVIDIFIGGISLLLALRIVLRLLAASPSSNFVAWLYETTGRLILPFEGMFPTLIFGSGSALEFSSLFALIAYTFIGWLLIRFLHFLTDTILKIDADDRV